MWNHALFTALGASDLIRSRLHLYANLYRNKLQQKCVYRAEYRCLPKQIFCNELQDTYIMQT